jgi:hypothetical protein
MSLQMGVVRLVGLGVLGVSGFHLHARMPSLDRATMRVYPVEAAPQVRKPKLNDREIRIPLVFIPNSLRSDRRFMIRMFRGRRNLLANSYTESREGCVKYIGTHTFKAHLDKDDLVVDTIVDEVFLSSEIWTLWVEQGGIDDSNGLWIDARSTSRYFADAIEIVFDTSVRKKVEIDRSHGTFAVIRVSTQVGDEYKQEPESLLRGTCYAIDDRRSLLREIVIASVLPCATRMLATGTVRVH